MTVKLGYSFAQAIAAADDPWYVAITYNRFLASLPKGVVDYRTLSKLAEAETRDRVWAERVS